VNGAFMKNDNNVVLISNDDQQTDVTQNEELQQATSESYPHHIESLVTSESTEINFNCFVLGYN